MVGWLGSKSEADALTMAEAHEIAAHWHEEPPLDDCVRAYLGIKPGAQQDQSGSIDAPAGGEISAEQYEQLVATMKWQAATYGVRKHAG